jgi:hypothetical protein
MRVSIVPEGLGFLSRSRQGSEQSSSILRLCPDLSNESRRVAATVKSLYSEMAKVYRGARNPPFWSPAASLRFFSEELDPMKVTLLLTALLAFSCGFCASAARAAGPAAH